ncbi:hypothetical protein HC766_03570 [Candidatus Gracilibacteria bacterium]|nr:hypothetical protein [Thermales bacterium]NJL96218.1 hypothetical protein [Candidatus Gracilibacteria bacterium]NJS41424.1 hypothetical protein [Candidatus Gracilibacteria bacterium]
MFILSKEHGICFAFRYCGAAPLLVLFLVEGKKSSLIFSCPITSIDNFYRSSCGIITLGVKKIQLTQNERLNFSFWLRSKKIEILNNSFNSLLSPKITN